MNDQMKETNSDLSNELTHGHGTEVMHVDKESGEIIEGVFDKKIRNITFALFAENIIWKYIR